MKIQGRDVDTFTASYIETAFWTSLGEDDQPLDECHGPEDLAPETLDVMIAECAAFQAAHGDRIWQNLNLSPWPPEKRVAWECVPTSRPDLDVKRCAECAAREGMRRIACESKPECRAGKETDRE